MSATGGPMTFLPHGRHLHDRTTLVDCTADIGQDLPYPKAVAALRRA